MELDGISGTRLNVKSQANLSVKNVNLKGGVFTAANDLTITNSSFAAFNPVKPEGSTLTVDHYANLTGENITVDKCEFEKCRVTSPENCASITIKDSTLNLDGKITANKNTMLTIDNCNFTATGQSDGVTNIPAENITLTNCEITKGDWTKKGEFEILPTSTSTDDSDTESDTSSDVTSDTESDTASDITTDTESDTASNVTSDTDSGETPDVPTSPDFKPDENRNWTPEMTDGLMLTLENADESELTGIILNGETVDPSNYSVTKTKDGIEITLSSGFLQTLADGSYKLIANFTNGYAETQIMTESSTSPIGTYGDLDGNGEITAKDALTILRSSIGMETLTPEQIALADVDVDGDITANDALVVLRYSVGMGDGGNVGKPI